MKKPVEDLIFYKPPSGQDIVSTEPRRPNFWARVLGSVCLLLSVLAVTMDVVSASILIPQAFRLEAIFDSMVVDLPTELRDIESERDQGIIFASWVLGSVCIVLASILGACISIRQILLHITPGDPGYGEPVMGLHLYTWALIVFACLLLDAGVHLTFIREDIPIEPLNPPILSRLVLWLFLLVIAANIIAVFVQTGFHWFLLDIPTSYRLLR